MDQYFIKINEQLEITTTSSEIEDQDIIRLSRAEYHCLFSQRSFKAEIINIDSHSNEVLLNVNGRQYSCQISNSLNLRIQSLNGNSKRRKQQGQLVASMPGMVLSILVEEGQRVSKGDPLIILEAMKMENVLKAGVSGIVSKINCDNNSPVDKGQLLIELS